MAFWNGVVALVKALSPGWPWWAGLSVTFACLVVYICRKWAWYRLCCKALDKVSADRVAEVVVAFTSRDRP